MNIFKKLNYLKSIYDLNNIHKKLKKLNDYNIKKYPRLATYSFDIISTEISLFGIFEKKELENLKDCIFDKMNFMDSICLDVGANIGNHSLNFSKYFKYVHAFEPNPDTFQLLKFNTRNSNNICIYKYGLSDKIDEISVKFNKLKDRGHFSIHSDEKNNFKSNLFDEYKIKLKKFDDVFTNVNEKISFIKLDVEDYEIKVLNGMKISLQKHSPLIFFEQYQNQFTSNNNNYYSSPVIDFLKKNNYNYFYEQSFYRKWKFSNNHNSLFNKFLKIFEFIIFDLPKKENKLLPLNIFEKKDYNGIIASKNKLE